MLCTVPVNHVCVYILYLSMVYDSAALQGYKGMPIQFYNAIYVYVFVYYRSYFILSQFYHPWKVLLIVSEYIKGIS